MVLQELRKKEKENRKLQQELKLEKDKFDQMVSKYVKEVQDLHASIYEESQWKNKLQMELDTKVNILYYAEDKRTNLEILFAITGVRVGATPDQTGPDQC